MIVLVTGGCGFIGSHVVNHLLRQHPDWQVRVLDKLTYAGYPERIDAAFRNDERFTLIQGDILDRPLVEQAVSGVDAVIHCAAESHVSYSFVQGELFAETNVRGTSVLCETIAKIPVERLIYMSSSEVYGTCLHEPMDEEHPLNPRSPYAGSKAAGDRLAYSYYVTYGIPLVIVRPFNNLGPFQHTEKVIPRFIRSALEGETIEVHDDGTQTRDWLFVTDHAEAIERCLVAELATVKGEVINLGSGVETSIRTIAEQVLARLGHPDKLVLNSYQRPWASPTSRLLDHEGPRPVGLAGADPVCDGAGADHSVVHRQCLVVAEVSLSGWRCSRCGASLGAHRD